MNRITRYQVVLASLATVAALNFGVSAEEKAVPQKTASQPTAVKAEFNPVQAALADIASLEVGKNDWPQWGGSRYKNNTPPGTNIPTEWDVNEGTNIKWKVPIGSQSYGNPIVANGKVFLGTNNGKGYIKRFPDSVDLGCLIAFDEKDGTFLWQHSNPKLPTGRVHDWPLQGICCSPYVDGERLWYVTSRGEVACLDTKGFYDGKNDGPYKAEPNENTDEADVIWLYDMMGEQGVSQHNMCSCSVTCQGDILFVNTSNGLDASHINLPAPNAPSFMAMNRDTGEVLWTDKSPGTNILHGQWSSPTFAEIAGVPQVIFGGGDGWLYSFAPAGDGKGNSKMLWKFDCNPKDSKWVLGGSGTRNNIIATPVIYDDLLYIAVGQDPEHGEGIGNMYCLNPAGAEGDVSPTLVVDKDGNPVPHRRLQALDADEGEKEIPNEKSIVVWHFDELDANKDGEIDYEEEMHRACGTATIKDDLLYIADFSGIVYCLDAKAADEEKNPTLYWTYDMFSPAWGSPLVVDGKVYIGDEDGDLSIFEHSKEKKQINEIYMEDSIKSTPIVANNVLYIMTLNTLYAISPDGK
ncbi:MAG: PQQ-binding-like beta-propeller repeat protein [Planctomycetaceae bacterium]|nr:PQQ-binding-like beta-propeller repeat protein [Planctomycetaceae bacterium]